MRPIKMSKTDEQLKECMDRLEAVTERAKCLEEKVINLVLGMASGSLNPYTEGEEFEKLINILKNRRGIMNTDREAKGER